MSKQFLAVIAAIILVFIGIFAFSGKDDKQSVNKGALSQHTLGKGTTGVTLTEYGDYQCPYCQQYHATVKQITDTYGDKIKFQYRNYPLVNAHRNAFAAARAAEAAGEQGKYWEMHDILYENNDPQGASGWVASNESNVYFENFAKKINLDMTKFKADYASSKANDTINADLAEGTRLKITGTPTFFLNGKKINVSNSVDDFKKVIDEAIAKQNVKEPAASPSTPTADTSSAN